MAALSPWLPRRPAGERTQRCLSPPCGHCWAQGASVASASSRCGAALLSPACLQPQHLQTTAPGWGTCGCGCWRAGRHWDASKHLTLRQAGLGCRSPSQGGLPISPALPASSRAGMTEGLPSPRGQVPGLAVPGRQQAVLALAASPSAASSPGEGSFVPWASSPVVAPVVRGHWRFPGSCGWVWAGWHGGVWGGMAEEGAAILQVLGQKGGPMAKGPCGALLPMGHRRAQWCPEVG